MSDEIATAIENVARAIHNARAYMVSGLPPWEDADQAMRATAIFLAGAAVEAMGPSPAQLRRQREAFGRGRRPPGPRSKSA